MSDIEEISDELYQNAEIIESYAVEIRYPDYWCEPTKEEALEAYNIAMVFKKFVLARIAKNTEIL